VSSETKDPFREEVDAQEVDARRSAFMRATGKPRGGMSDAPPIPDGISAADAREGLRIAYGGDVQEDMRGNPLLDDVREFPALASDAEIRACSRLAAPAGVVQ
jgi:hypothetical protein